MSHAITRYPTMNAMTVETRVGPTATVELPQPKSVLNMRVDRDVLDFFRSQGRGYQTRINAVLRSYVDQAARRRRAG